jgi:hypothetical protein
MTDQATTTLRRCVGSKTFAIEPHDAPLTDFPVQPSRKDGLGAMCKPHWTEYTRGLRRAQLERQGKAPAHERTLAATMVGEGESVVTKPRSAKPKAEPKAARQERRDSAQQARSVAVEDKTNARRRDRTSRMDRAMYDEARRVVEATDRLSGEAYLAAIAGDEVQGALRVLAGTSEGPAIHEAMRERQVKYEAAITGAGDEGEGETPLGETIDGGTDEADAADADSAAGDEA